MIWKTLHSVCVITASMLMLASASGISAPLRSGNISELISQTETFPCAASHLASSTLVISPAFETLTAIHHLQTVADITEYCETETEDDDVSAHFLTTTDLFSLRLAASSLANAPPNGVAACLIPLYILHHSWKHFPARI